MKAQTWIQLLTLVFILTSGTSWSAEKLPTKRVEPNKEANADEKVNVENIKEKYWARGDETEIGVVQNRIYSKAHKFEGDLFAGVLTSDPFLSTKVLGLGVGYNFNEYINLSFLYLKLYSRGSGALDKFEQEKDGRVNTNFPYAYYGAETRASIIYGKLSLLGKSILYYDMHLLAGMGLTSTETGTFATPSLGIGQKIFLNKTMALGIDYRLMYYKENIKEKTITTSQGKVIGSRDNYNNVITLGLSFFFGGPSK